MRPAALRALVLERMADVVARTHRGGYRPAMRFPSLLLVAAAALPWLGCTKDTISPTPSPVPVTPPVLDAAPVNPAPANPAAAKRELTLTYFTMAG